MAAIAGLGRFGDVSPAANTQQTGTIEAGGTLLMVSSDLLPHTGQEN